MTALRRGTGRASASRARAGSRSRLEELRSSKGPPPEEPLILATLRIRMPRALWTGPFSTSHPSLRIEVINRTDLTEDNSISDYWISGQPPGIWAGEIAGYPDVLRVESLAEVADGCLYRITYRNPPVVSLYRRLRLPIQFPLRIQAGIITWEVIGRRPELDQVLRHAKAQNSEVWVESIRRRPLRSHLPVLTESQQHLLGQAMAAGYFAVPRAITLTELARVLGRSKSALSETLALIEKKLLESALRPSNRLP